MTQRASRKPLTVAGKPDRGQNSPAPALPRRPTTGATPDQRWQRTVRFNWDKGGSKGGRK